MTKYDFLMHHGVKGMKWGVRRYQNYDGTRIGASAKSSKSYGGFTKKEHNHGDWVQTTYRHESSSGRKAMDSDVEKELKENTEYVRKEWGDPEYEADVNSLYGYGDNLDTKLASAGSEFVAKVEKEGKEYAEKWLQESSALKDYDYELDLEEIDEGEKYVVASLRVFGDKYDFSVGVESDYWDDDRFTDKKAEARRQEKVRKLESSKEYKELMNRIDDLWDKAEKMKTTDPGYWNIYDELDELSYKQDEMYKKALGKDY